VEWCPAVPGRRLGRRRGRSTPTGGSTHSPRARVPLPTRGPPHLNLRVCSLFTSVEYPYTLIVHTHRILTPSSPTRFLFRLKCELCTGASVRYERTVRLSHHVKECAAPPGAAPRRCRVGPPGSPAPAAPGRSPEQALPLPPSAPTPFCADPPFSSQCPSAPSSRARHGISMPRCNDVCPPKKRGLRRTDV